MYRRHSYCPAGGRWNDVSLKPHGADIWRYPRETMVGGWAIGAPVYGILHRLFFIRLSIFRRTLVPYPFEISVSWLVQVTRQCREYPVRCPAFFGSFSTLRFSRRCNRCRKQTYEQPCRKSGDKTPRFVTSVLFFCTFFIFFRPGHRCNLVRRQTYEQPCRKSGDKTPRFVTSAHFLCTFAGEFVTFIIFTDR